ARTRRQTRPRSLCAGHRAHVVRLGLAGRRTGVPPGTRTGSERRARPQLVRRPPVAAATAPGSGWRTRARTRRRSAFADCQREPGSRALLGPALRRGHRAGETDARTGSAIRNRAVLAGRIAAPSGPLEGSRGPASTSVAGAGADRRAHVRARRLP